MRFALAVLLSFVALPAFAQQAPTTGEPIGKMKLDVGESIETRLGVGQSLAMFTGLGVTKDVDAYMAIGNDHEGSWLGFGIQAATIRTENFAFALSAMMKVAGGIGMAPRFILTEKISPRVHVYGGASYYMAPADHFEYDGWEMPLGVRAKVDDRLDLIGEMVYGQTVSARVSISYHVGTLSLTH